MEAMPRTVPISAMRQRQGEVLEEMGKGPVLLTQRGHGAAVLVSLEDWNRMIEEFEDLQDALDVIEARQDPQPAMELEAYFAERNEACI